ncbi:hypothetical protein FNV43_RR07913 [Rhamnella rubrinervis]|uniref:Wax synthase domain-containing protein n=1 Tax=Rhamnella rubrinervis TaxID=2594499 RepID=A0A8K0HFK0_9ROSA|nr:hypothetical protein FNV43_RR07913 [Rhamnella rubrinervis]
MADLPLGHTAKLQRISRIQLVDDPVLARTSTVGTALSLTIPFSPATEHEASLPSSLLGLPTSNSYSSLSVKALCVPPLQSLSEVSSPLLVYPSRSKNPPPKPVEKFQNHVKEIHPYPRPHQKRHGQQSLLNYATKGLILALLMRAHDYSEKLNGEAVLVIYSLHIYLGLEIALAMVASFSRALIGLELEPQFDEPYLSTSLHDFWGRRWNIMVTSILRPTVYEPALKLAATITGRRWAPLPAVMTTFVASAIMHELMFFYLGRVRPTWEITWFFLLHGACLTVEIALKKTLMTRELRLLPRFISGPLTVGFVMVTAFWLFFPQLLRCNGDVRAFEEYAAVGAFAKNVVGGAFTLEKEISTTTLY